MVGVDRTIATEGSIPRVSASPDWARAHRS